MALRFIDGFEHYTIPADLTQKWNSYNQATTSTPIGSNAGRRADSTALRIRNDQDWVSITFDNQSTWYVGFAMYLFGNETSDLIRFYDSDGNTQCYVNLTSAGIFQLYRGTTLIASSSNSIPNGSWNYIEVQLSIANSGGVFEVRVNEQVWVSFTGDTQQSSTNTLANRIILYGRDVHVAYDDLYICDGVGSTNNTYLGDVRIDTVRPNGAGNYADFSRQGGATNWENVDDTLIDADSGYNYSNTVGHKDSFDCANLPSIAGTIFGVQVSLGARKDDAGSRTLRALTRLASTDYEGSDLAPGTDYRFFRHIWEQNPNTSAAWTEAQINGAEFGYKVQA
ncbi:MAG: hypothetical protein AB7U41_02450 [Dongiaceae bacterium]